MLYDADAVSPAVLESFVLQEDEELMTLSAAALIRARGN